MRISLEERELFSSLTELRQKLADALEQPAARGIKRSVTDKYSDQAHFIYELLQNSEDVKATKISFLLKNEGLIYSHNGLDNFTITDPIREGDNEVLGHINSITSVGNSSKSEHGDNKDKIGKFGVGFKAVFQYTETPHICDDNFWFKIERFIVPILLDKDIEGRKSGDTSFYFPFNKPEKKSSECFDEIFSKLKSLSNPLLFLRNLTYIYWETDSSKGFYAKDLIEDYTSGQLRIQKIKLTQRLDDDKDNKPETEYFYVFTESIEANHLCSIAYRVDENNEVLYDQKIPAYCFFFHKRRNSVEFYHSCSISIN